MFNPLIDMLALPQVVVQPMPPDAAPSVPQPAAEPIPIDGERFICPVTKLETRVHGHIIERDKNHENHWWGCWSCAGLYWTPEMPVPVGKSWHCVRVPLTPEPTPADWLAQLIAEFAAMRDVAQAALSDMPHDADYAKHLDDLLTRCRHIVADMRQHEERLLPSVITIHP